MPVTRTPRRLGVYQDGPFRIIDDGSEQRLVPVSSDRAFLRFAREVGSSFDSTVLFVRARHVADDGGDLELDADVGFVELPYYESLVEMGQVARAAPGTFRAFWRGLGQVDAVWVLGPHPFSLALIVLAVVRRKRVVLGVRQDTVAYFRSRLRGGRAGPALLAARVWDLGYRLFSRRLGTVVVGSELERKYGGPRPGVLAINVSQIRDSDVVSTPPPRDWEGAVRLLTVGRIDREKNPLLLVDAVARLCEGEGNYSLMWVGSGPLEDDVRRRAEELGVLDRIDLLGFVPFGPQLLDLYRTSHIFVHVSLTEGVPATSDRGSRERDARRRDRGVANWCRRLSSTGSWTARSARRLRRARCCDDRLARDQGLWERLASYGPTGGAAHLTQRCTFRRATASGVRDPGVARVSSTTPEVSRRSCPVGGDARSAVRPGSARRSRAYRASRSVAVAAPEASIGLSESASPTRPGV